jgi:hypothetical protein
MDPFTISAVLGATAIGLSAMVNAAVNWRNTNKSQQLQQELEEQRQQTQLKLAYVQLQTQQRLEAERQDFQTELQANQQAFQERMAFLGFSQQLTLEKARQEFQWRLSELQHERQVELTQFIKSVDVAIHQENLEFQRWCFAQEKALQQELAGYNRATQMALAAYQRETILKAAEAQRLFDNWPLRIVPAQILSAHQTLPVAPLRVVVAPPVVEFDRHSSDDHQKSFPKIGKRVAEALRQMCNQHYPLGGNQRPVELLDGAWDSSRYFGGASILSLYSMLQSEPVLVLQSDVDGEYLNFRIAYWGPGQTPHHYETILHQFPFQEVIYESAKTRTIAWQQLRQELLADGVGNTLEEIDKEYGGIRAENLKLLQKEEQLKRADVKIRYKFEAEDVDKLSALLAIYHCVVTGVMADMHFLVHQNVLPAISDWLPTISLQQSSLTDLPLQNWILTNYFSMFDALTQERSYTVPDLALQLASNISRLPDKSWAERYVNYSVNRLLNLRGIIKPNLVSDVDKMYPVLSQNDDEYFDKLAACLKKLNDDQSRLARELLDTWYRLIILGKIGSNKQIGDRLFL